MKIGPVDIRNHMFAKRAMRGLDEAEVRAYLDLVADVLEESVLEAEELRAGIDRLEARLSEYGTLERTLRDSLVAGEKVSEERVLHAEREARIVIKNAEVDAEKIVGGARQEVARLRAAMDDLRRQRITYAERFRALLRSQFRILEASLESYDPDGTDVDRVLDEIDRGLALSGPLAGEPLGSEPPRVARMQPEPQPVGLPPAGPPRADRFPEDPPQTGLYPGGDREEGPRDHPDTPWPAESPLEDRFRAPDGFHAPPPPPSAGRPPSGDVPLSSYLGEDGLFSTAGGEDDRRSEEG